MAKLIEGIKTPNGQDPCGDWLLFHTQMKKKYGKENAAMIWTMAWSYAGSDSCAINSDFKGHMKKQGIEVGNIATDAVGGAVDLVGDVFGIFGNLAKVAKYAIPALGGLLLVAGLIFIFRTAKTATPKDVIMYGTPQGRLATIAGT